jgi:hypothetical protein
VHIHNAPLQQMTKSVIKKVAKKIGALIDPNLEGAKKLDVFARLRVSINPDKGLKDHIILNLSDG